MIVRAALLRQLSALAHRILGVFRYLGSWRKRRARRKALEAACSCNLGQVLSIVEAAIYAASGVTVKHSRYIYAGGSNNLGFVMHRAGVNGKQILTTKLAYTEAARRERQFFQWSHTHIDITEKFIPRLFAYGMLPQAQGEFLTVEGLRKVKKVNYPQMAALYQSIGKASELLLKQQEWVSNIEPLKGGSVIRDLILSLVCGRDVEAGECYIKEFFRIRKNRLSMHIEKLDNILEFLLRFYLTIGLSNTGTIGLVHGDFKPKNMMLDAQGHLKLIDYQYATIGARVWDLAFFLSKDKRGFNSGFSKLTTSLILSDRDRRYLLFLYIFASLLHIRRNKFEKKYRLCIWPALNKLRADIGDLL